MSDSQALAVREKQELAKQEEKTVPGRYYVPATDIFETDEALTLMLEMPGVAKDNVDVQIENVQLKLERMGRVAETGRDFAAIAEVEARELMPLLALRATVERVACV